MGRSLQKDFGMEPQAALFMPILEGLDGVEKMSKSLGNHIGVQEDAKVMFKKVMEVPDALIIRYFELATDILPEELDTVKEALKNGANPKDYKLMLARSITSLYHSREETEAAETFFNQAFTRKEIVNDGIISSNSELRRLLSQGGVSLNGEKVSAPDTPVKSGDVLKLGKKRFVKLIL